MKNLMLILFLWVGISTVRSQSDPANLVFSVNAGYGRLLANPLGMTDMSDRYLEKLRNGLVWDMSFGAYFNRYIGLGLFYSGYRSSAEAENSFDRLHTSYVAPVFLTRFVSGDFEFKLNAGLGYFRYATNGEVYGKPRLAVSSSVAGNIGMGADYHINRYLSVGLQLNMIFYNINRLNTTYRKQTTIVEFRDGSNTGISSFNLGAGIRCCIP